MQDGQPVGGVVIKVNGDRGDLDLLFVSPRVHSKGIGYAAWCAVERLHPEVTVWETVTPYFEKRNEEAFKQALDHVTAVYPHTLIFYLRDGREEKLEWQNRSRAESWTPEMKEKAREKARRTNDGKNSD